MPKCGKCNKDFGSEEALGQHATASHGQGTLGKAAKVQDAAAGVGKSKAKFYGLAVVIVLALAAGAYAFSGSGGAQVTGNVIGAGLGAPPINPIHWHPNVEFTVCGESRPTPKALTGHLGTNLLHYHADEGVIHIEGLIPHWAEITLGKAMDVGNIKFSSTELFEYKNGDTCPGGTVGKVSMTVDGLANEEFRDHVLRDGEKIKLVFG